MNNLSATITNRSARFNYEILETFTAGIVLIGYEVLSLREGKANVSESFCMIEDGQLILKNMHINSPRSVMSIDNLSETRDRVLLMKKSEINSLYKKVSIKGNSLVPLKVYRNERGLYKVELGLCRGKKDYDKRETIKERATKKDMARAMKNY